MGYFVKCWKIFWAGKGAAYSTRDRN